MRRPVRLLAAAALAAATFVPALPGPAHSGPAPAPGLAPVQDFLSGRLTSLLSGKKVTVLVHGSSLAAAENAVAATGMTRTSSFDGIGVVVARATKAQITAARLQPGVTYLEGNQPIELSGYTSNTATRGRRGVPDAHGSRRQRPGRCGRQRRSHRLRRRPDPPLPPGPGRHQCGRQQPQGALRPARGCLPGPGRRHERDTDTLSVGGHGTHVAGIIAGRPTELSTGETLHGAAPSPRSSPCRQVPPSSSSAQTPPSTGYWRTTRRRAAPTSRPRCARRSR